MKTKQISDENMFYVPYTNKRFIFKAERDRVIRAAHTGWGRKRAERFFARFLYEDKSPLKCLLFHPITAVRFMIAEAKINLTICGVRLRKADSKIITSAPLTEVEQNFISLAFVPYNCYISPNFYRETLDRALAAIKLGQNGTSAMKLEIAQA